MISVEILDRSKLKAFADDKIKSDLKVEIFVGCTAENILEKGENAGYQHFLLFPKRFQMPPSSVMLKDGIGLNPLRLENDQYEV